MRYLISLSLIWLFLITVTIGSAQEDHSAHHAMMQHKHYTRSLETYLIPEKVLTNQDKQEMTLPSLLQTNQPIALNFIFTTCTTICPVMTATFAKMYQQLDTAEAKQLRMISISIDPEQDTPQALKTYAKRYQAQPQWQFLTGDLESIITVQKAFNAYTGNKMNHRPLTFFKHPDQDKWVRIEGLASSADLAKEYRQLFSQ